MLFSERSLAFLQKVVLAIVILHLTLITRGSQNHGHFSQRPGFGIWSPLGW